MSQTVFKGAAKAGLFSATFLSDASNAASDLLVASYAETGGSHPQVDQSAAAPGGEASASVSAPRRGVLEVWLVAGHADDRGRLRVSNDKGPLDDEDVRGSVRWVYAVEAS